MIIRNRHEISITELRKQALDIIEAGIERVLPPNIMRSVVRYETAGRILTVGDDVYHLSRGRIFVIGGGKASGLMAETFESIIHPDNITTGVVSCKSKDYKTSNSNIFNNSLKHYLSSIY